VKDQINTDITALKEAMNGDDGDRIKEAIEKLKTSSMEIGKSIYSQSNNSSEGGEQ